MTMRSIKDLSLKGILLETGLYDSISFNPNIHINEILNLDNIQETFSVYCPTCKNNTVIIPEEDLTNAHYPKRGFKRIIEDRFIGVTYKCSLNNKHLFSFLFHIDENKIIKIGQYPSVADLNEGNMGEYKVILDNDKYLELKKSIGLFSHGLGIPPVVYLRRIFENLINETYDEHKEELSVENFYSIKMKDKIQVLKKYLPSLVYEYKTILYSLMSKGIHELSEQECKEIYPLLLIAVKLILEEKLKEYKKNKITKENKKQLEELFQKYRQ